LLDEFQGAQSYLKKLKCGLIVGSGNHDARNTGYRLFPTFFGKQWSITETGKAVIIMLDSSRPDQDGGEVGYRQRLWLKKCLKKYRDKFKIVAMHHHLLPAPDTGMEKNMAVDAGDVLWTIISNNVNLVLCGHRHRPWIWRLGDLSIVYAGAVSTSRLRGFYRNSYNILRINGDKAGISLKIVGDGEYPLEANTLKTLSRTHSKK
jgi:3',5'-cyclic AMP phosphodiesterase CpdA